LPVQSVFHNDEIETEILRASSTSEFSHSLGQKLRFGDVRVASALPPKADIHRKGRHVSNVPTGRQQNVAP
jgi:hypothetical protein